MTKSSDDLNSPGSIQNITIEERVALLEIQVIEIEEDVSELNEGVDFLFDEQVIQGQRLLNLEETSVEVVVELAEISVDLLSKRIRSFTLLFYFGIDFYCLIFFIIDLNFRVTTLEENGGGAMGTALWQNWK